jgi:uncharacterized protein (DUF924 family)
VSFGGCLNRVISYATKYAINYATKNVRKLKVEAMYQDIIKFWFEEIEEAFWWKKDEGFDQLLRDRFSTIHQQARQGELSTWRATAQGRLAEIIVLDQFSRNMFRDTPQAFAYDGIALVLAQEAIAANADAQLTAKEKSFLYMPFMHSESLAIHEVAVALFEKNGNEGSLNFELKHKHIIEKFGRYPHRNSILGRASTEEEIAFLSQPNSSF